MKVLRRHVASTVFFAILLVLMVLVALNALGSIIEQVGDISGDYTFAKVLQYTAWRTPGFIVANVGFATLIGCLIGLGLLANQNELTVMRASGVSIARIVWLVMRPILWVIIAGLFLGELSPYTERIAEGSRDIALSAASEKKQQKQIVNAHVPWLGADVDSRLEKSVWNREANEFIRFTTVLPNGKVYGITRFGFNQDKSIASIQFAREGTFERDGWLLEQVNTTYFDKTELREEREPSIYWNTKITPEMLTFVSTEPENLTFRELGKYGGFLQEQQRDNHPYQLEWWKKIVKPLEVLSLVVIAISFIFGPLRQVTMGQRVFTGVMVGVVFQTLQNMSATSSLVFGFSPLAAVLVPILVCLSIGVVLLSRVR